MCGITGYLQFDHLSKPFEIEIKNSVMKLNRRGPDHQETLLGKGFGLGHSRLSIIDLASTANQPMKDKSGRYSIAFNGEIFNYKELRKELHLDIKTHSDTEVLLETYALIGEKCVEKLSGFFAFAIYDHHDHSLFLARDRYGIKPLLYSSTKEGFFFSSELKALTEFPIEKDLNQDSFNSFFRLSYIPSPLAIFKNTYKVKPGTFLKISKSGIKEYRYYHLKIHEPLISDEQEARTEVFNRVKGAVNKWLLSDAPLGAFLSGGLDSSIVVALASQEIPNLKTFSVSFPESPFHDESKYAELVANKFKTDHHVIPITQANLYSYVDEVLDYLDEPFSDSSAIPSYALCRFVSKEVKVALSGDGADEIFGGYEKYRGESLARALSCLSPLSKLILPLTSQLPHSRDSKFLNFIRKGKRFLEGTTLDQETRYWEWCSFNSKELLNEVLVDTRNLDNWQQGFFSDEFKNVSGLNQNFLKDTTLVLPGDMLTKVDLMSMSNSLEVRPIFLEHTVVDYAFHLPSHFKIHRNRKKKILVDAFKHLLPPEVYSRPKHGFSIELMPFFRGQFWERLNDTFLNEKFVKEQGLFKLKGIEELKKSIKGGEHKDIQALVWSLIVFQSFWLKYKMRIT